MRKETPRAHARKNPHLNIVGSQQGYFTSEEEPSIFKTIIASRPDFLWLGLGTPKQQELLQHLKPLLPSGILLAVGFAFDVNAGTKPDAPAWMQRAGLTWTYRLATEPRRLTARYLKWNTLFLYYLLKSRLHRKQAKNF